MRQYTVVFMEHRIGTSQLMPMTGEHGTVSFTAEDEDAALVHIEEHLLQPLKSCARAELSSLRIVADPTSPSGTRLIDDTHANPNFQDIYLKYNPVTKAAEVDWDSTRTLFGAEIPVLTSFAQR